MLKRINTLSVLWMLCIVLKRFSWKWPFIIFQWIQLNSFDIMRNTIVHFNSLKSVSLGFNSSYIFSSKQTPKNKTFCGLCILTSLFKSLFIHLEFIVNFFSLYSKWEWWTWNIYKICIHRVQSFEFNWNTCFASCQT